MNVFSYNQVVFEVSGICNARCPFCSTGSGTLPKGTFINVDLFKKAIDKLVKEQLIDKDGYICLYSWGEPFLHKDLPELIAHLSDYNIAYTISTNGSVYKEFKPNMVDNLKKIGFSMPGFSQDSYDRIHGFNFEQIKTNISRYVDTLRELNYRGEIVIYYHIYQFNLDEISYAKTFAKNLNIEFSPDYAYLADYELFKKYLEGTLSYDELNFISKNLFCHSLIKKTNERPPDYICPQKNILVLDERANILTCCFLSKIHPEYSHGNLFDNNLFEVLEKKNKADECEFCSKKGIDYCIHTVEIPSFCNEEIPELGNEEDEKINNFPMKRLIIQLKSRFISKSKGLD
jgi:MoaA/NifB/PqqE/SkfB family radical SAM enzyme